MFAKLPESQGRVIGFKASGKLTVADYENTLIPQLEAAIKESGKICVLLDFADFEGIEVRAAWDDLKVGLQHSADFARIALVGDRAWEEWLVNLAKPFTSAEIRYFDETKTQAAWDWLRGSVDAL